MGIQIKFIFLLLIGGIATFDLPLNPLEIERDFTQSPTVNEFNIYWNAPTYLCKQHKIDFEEILKENGILVNNGDKFRGEKIVILYDPGEFPIYLKDKATGKLVEVNGGVPHKGDLDLHLKKFREVFMNHNVVPADFSGIGILDFEVWRPIFRQHWNDQKLYTNKTLEIVQKENGNLKSGELRNTASKLFEEYARKFLEETLKEAKKLRPNAKWGYYGFPYCLNYGSKHSADCPAMVKNENDQILWLFENSDAFYLSLYSPSKLTDNDLRYFIRGRMNEAWRIAHKVSKGNGPLVLPYIWPKYNNEDKFMSEEDTNILLEEIARQNLGGAIVWASSKELQSKEDCENYKNYVIDTLGPAIENARNINSRCKKGKKKKKKYYKKYY